MSTTTTTTTTETLTNGKSRREDQLELKRLVEVGPLGRSQSRSRQQAARLADFYAGKNIFITGATGFIGKVCLVKLLASLDSCAKVYVLLRAKRGLSSQQRFNKLLGEEPFRSARSYRGQRELDWSKVVALDGDMSSEELGLSEDHKRLLCANVHVVFNIAASVQFDAPLKQNLRDNFLGVRNLLALAGKLERLLSLVHVSTFYSNSHLSHVEERVLPMNRDCEKVAELLSWIPDELCETIAPQIMENRPNTYIFTKAMAEQLVQKHEGKLPLAILRPSIVTPAVREPSPGWVDNVNGPMGLGVLASLGILRNIDWNYYGVADAIPVDFVVNSMLAVAERTARLHPSEIKVYNCSSSSLRPTTWGRIFEVLRAESFKSPPYKMLRVPIEVPRHKRANRLGFALSKLSELFFAYFIDFVLMLCGQKQLLTKLTSKLHHGYEILRPFTTTEYTCNNDNLLASLNELHPDDRVEFQFDVKSLDWEKNLVDSYYGARKRLLKEDMSNVSAAIFKMRILMAVEFTFKVLFWASSAWLAYKLYDNQVRSLNPS